MKRKTFFRSQNDELLQFLLPTGCRRRQARLSRPPEERGGWPGQQIILNDRQTTFIQNQRRSYTYA
jgi:hypothetical protein